MPVDADTARYLYAPIIGLGASVIGLLGGWLTAQYSARAANAAWQRSRDEALNAWARSQSDALAAWERSREDATKAWERAQFTAAAAWVRARDDEKAKLTVGALRDVATQVSRCFHNACWIGWRACYDPDALTDDSFKEYDSDMHKILPELLGAHAALTSIDGKAADALADVVNRAFILDGAVGSACIAWKSGNRRELQNLYTEAQQSEDALVALLRDVAANVLVTSNQNQES